MLDGALPARLSRVARTSVAVWVCVLAVGCGREDVSALAAQTDQERLLPAIVNEQVERVAAARERARRSHDEALAVRLRQSALEMYGRGDLAEALESEALERERDARLSRAQLKDEEDALRAYRQYGGMSSGMDLVAPTGRATAPVTAPAGRPTPRRSPQARSRAFWPAGSPE